MEAVDEAMGLVEISAQLRRPASVGCSASGTQVPAIALRSLELLGDFGDVFVQRVQQQPCLRYCRLLDHGCIVSPTTMGRATEVFDQLNGRIQTMRMSAKAEYAVRAMVQLATVDDGALVKTEDLANAQGIPAQFLVDILSDLRTDRLVRSHRGRDGGYQLGRPAVEISIADVLRCIDGPLASVRDIGLGDLPYSGPTAALTDVWRALRASMRSVLEQTSLSDVATGALPRHVAGLADDYRGQENERGHRTVG